jgi:hypothetical protein
MGRDSVLSIFNVPVFVFHSESVFPGTDILKQPGIRELSSISRWEVNNKTSMRGSQETVKISPLNLNVTTSRSGLHQPFSSCSRVCGRPLDSHHGNESRAAIHPAYLGSGYLPYSARARMLSQLCFVRE